jgi:outer membrane receptor for ferrienterochelin and colicins
MHKQAHVFLYILFLIGFSAIAQETTPDTIKKSGPTHLEEVVVTGQIEPQSLKRSVQNVRVITKVDIQRLAANSLADVLNQYLNINVRTNDQTGRSTVSMFGLDGQYFKILIDNIPVVSDEGLGNNIDLNQINLNDVERIEIIEGSMGVTHGANAVSGILNIITKKSADHKWELNAAVQEETVGKEYALFDKGKHIQNFKVSNNISKDWFVSVGANRTDFAGFYNNMKGRDYAENDGLRGFSTWLPKEQVITNALINYNREKFRIFYKFDYMNEVIDYANPVVAPQDNYPFPATYFSKDKRYYVNRYYHHLNSYGHILPHLNYNISVSYQKQQRDLENYNYFILTRDEVDNKKVTYQSKEVLYSTGQFTNFLNSKYVDLQIGYELVNDKSYADGSSGTFLDEDKDYTPIRARIENYDIYASAEVKVNENFSIRPGYRYSFQSAFENQNATSVGFRYLLSKDWETRASFGKSYRTPNFDELYTYMVDNNHNLQGNKDLVPEQSMSYEASVKKSTSFNSELTLSNSLIVNYLDVDDKISLVLVSLTPVQAYKYLNIDKYRMWNFSTLHQMHYKNFDAKVGASLVGVSQKIDTSAQGTVSGDNYLFSLQLNAGLGYNVPEWNTVFATYYKFNGRYQQYIDNGDGTFGLSTVPSYSMMDASVTKTFFKNQFSVTAGARNLFNVKNVQTGQSGGIGGGAHAGASGNLPLGYGTSFFVKLSYNLNFN